jgi:hypothetical protein
VHTTTDITTNDNDDNNSTRTTSTMATTTHHHHHHHLDASTTMGTKERSGEGEGDEGNEIRDGENLGCPNDARHVVWAIGTCFFILSYFFNTN